MRRRLAALELIVPIPPEAPAHAGVVARRGALESAHVLAAV